MKSTALKFAVPCALWLLAGGGVARGDIVTYTAIPMSGSQQVPAVGTSGFGWLTGTYDTATRILTFSFNWQLDGGATLTAVHFHGPAPVGQNASVAVPVNGPAANNLGSFGASVTLAQGQETDLLAGKWYLNVHSSAFPNGEVRGQLIADGAGPNAPFFSPTSGALGLPSVLVPQIGVFGAQLQLVPGSNPAQFQIQGATQLR